MPGAVRKVQRLTGVGGHEVLLAISGDGALAGIARRGLRIDAVPDQDADPQDFADQVAQTMSELAREAGILEDGRMAGMLLLGWNGWLWTLLHAQAVPHPDGIAAVGSGGDAAIGAVDVLLDIGAPPAEAVVRAVEVAIVRDLNSAGPVLLEVLDPVIPPGGSDVER